MAFQVGPFQPAYQQVAGGAPPIEPSPEPEGYRVVGPYGRMPIRQVVRHEDDELAIIVALIARML